MIKPNVKQLLVKVKQKFYIPSNTLDIATVKMGAELLIVSVKLTATQFNDINPRITVINLKKKLQKLK